MNRLFIIGNGFDLSHNLPTKFNPDFKRIAESFEQNSEFWNMYQTEEKDIWADFENCLAKPDFNSLEEIFIGYEPDYYSEHESDRDAIITQVDLNANLTDELYAFAEQAETAINSTNSPPQYSGLFETSDLFINFNYTHTIEKIYNINSRKILHIHGEVGLDNLILGYPEGEYSPNKYYYDVRGKGVGPYAEVDIEEHIERMSADEMIDYFTYVAYKNLIQKTKSFEKEYQISDLEFFLDGVNIEEIVVIGHSCAIDFTYFKFINAKFPKSQWKFNAYDNETKKRIQVMVKRIGIRHYSIDC